MDSAFAEVQIDGVAHGGYCVSRLPQGKVVMVRGALPAEQVRIQVTSQRSKVAYGRVVEVLDASPDRVEHIWPEGNTLDLGGVELGHVAPGAQLRWKREVLRQALRRNGSEALEAEIASVCGQWRVHAGGAPVEDGTPAEGVAAVAGGSGQRTRLSFTVCRGGDLGMYEAASNILHPVKTMPLMVPQLAELGWLRPGLLSKRLGLAPGTRVKFVAPSDSAPVIYADSEVFGADFQPQSSRVREKVAVGGIECGFRIYAGSFWQTDYLAPSTLVGAMLESLGDISGWEVIELYAGSGLFSAFLAQALGPRGYLTTVESDGPAVKSAHYNLKSAPTAKTQVLRGNVNAVLVRELELGENYSEGTLVLADPPRAGLGKNVVEAICAKEPLRIGLFSCDPVSGARDLELLRNRGYSIRDFRAFDLFRHTFHLESWALAERKK